MKRLFLFIALVLPVAACADGQKPVDFAALPLQAKTFASTYFADAKVSLTTVDKELAGTSYDLYFADGRKVEFNSKGEWTEVDCKRTAVPAGIVPEAIAKHMAANYPGNFLCDISRNKRGWEVSLNNGLDLKFDTRFRLVELDD